MLEFQAFLGQVRLVDGKNCFHIQLIVQLHLFINYPFMRTIQFRSAESLF